MEKYGHQKMMIINVNNYAYLVRFVENERELFLKTIIPGRKATRDYDNKMDDLDKEEKEVLDSFDSGEWNSVEEDSDEYNRLITLAQLTVCKK